MNKIYPQVNNIPIYNPSGKYWIKLYNYGKLYKVEIDDRMPFNEYDDLKTAKCEILEELWPPILTKAIIKFFKYKFINTNNSYDEIGDFHIIYALTGYLGERIMLKNLNANGSPLLNKNNWSNRSLSNIKILENNSKRDKNNKEKKLLKNKFFDCNDSLNNESTKEKLLNLVVNIMRNDNYVKKKNFLLNFNTLNKYSQKKILNTIEDTEKKKPRIRFDLDNSNSNYLSSSIKNTDSNVKKNKKESKTSILTVEMARSSNKKLARIIQSQQELEKFEKSRRLNFNRCNLP